MDDYILRPYAPGDRDGCAALWEQVFGDPAELVTQFLSLFEAQEGFCLLAEHSGEIAAAAYSLPGLTVLRPGRPDLPARYLYAVATHPVHRKNGLAAALCRGLRDDAFVQGALLLTKPAEPSLYPWYAEKIGVVPAMPCRRVTVTTPCGGDVTPLTPKQYSTAREARLSGVPHVRLPDALFVWEHLLHKHYGGGFYAVNGGIADIYAGESLELPELLADVPEAAVGALLRQFGAREATACLPGDEEDYISCAAPDSLTDSLPDVWFGPVFG